jgi:hypothetical protein
MLSFLIANGSEQKCPRSAVEDNKEEPMFVKQCG